MDLTRIHFLDEFLGYLSIIFLVFHKDTNLGTNQREKEVLRFRLRENKKRLTIMRRNHLLEIRFFIISLIDCRALPRTTFVISTVFYYFVKNLYEIVIDLY